ncbi:iron-sulfur cluster assembly protein, partial [uncultured Porphyromonas sp.]
METLQLEEQIVKMLRTVYDPEIPVNIYDLGL